MTTTIRLPDDLKARVAKLAKRSGTTTHGFILDAIAEKTRQEEQRTEFEEVADARLARIAETGETISWPKLRGYLEERMAGRTVKRPTPRKMAR